MTRSEKAFYKRAEEIWFEKLYEQEDYSFLKALAQAWKEEYQRKKRGPQRYKLF
jgi:hypothetical protein